MKKSLTEFAENFESRFKERGRDLYELNAVSNPTKEGNTYYFEVNGTTDDYETMLQLNDENEVKDCSCTCPHFCSGHLCKHLYASLLKPDEVLDMNDDDLSFLPLQIHETHRPYRILHRLRQRQNRTHLQESIFPKRTRSHFYGI